MEPQDDNLSIHSAETIEVANCSERLRGFAVRLVISLVVIGACAGALVWSVENGMYFAIDSFSYDREAGTYNGPVNVRNASVNFSIFVDEFSVSKGVYSVRYRLPDSVNGSIGVPQVYPSFWYQDNTNKRLVHQINAYATIYAMDSYSFWVNYDEAGNISSCRYDNNTSYQLYIDRLGLTNLTHEYSAMEHIRNHKRVFIYEGDSSDVHLEFIPQSAFLVTTYADAETEYKDTDGTLFEGFLCYPSSVTASHKLPGVLVHHAFGGCGKLEQQKAVALAKVG
uniref:Peptidase_S9 domain-containing protein n=1 Tax=Heterorhabditis bacteriophora TaxID=37862 RepID=A0A1I7XTV5_HETBA